MRSSWRSGLHRAAAPTCWRSRCFLIDWKADRGLSARKRSLLMETLNYEYEAKGFLTGRAHVGVVGSGDLEVLIEPSNSPTTQVRVRTSVDGYAAVWKAVLDRFFSRFESAAKV